MQINKKGEGTASSFLISAIIATTLLVFIGISVNDLASEYGESSIDYFDNYTSINSNVTGVGNDFIGAYDIDQNSSKPEIERTEDVMFWKSFKIIGKIPKLIGSVYKGMGVLGSDLGIPKLIVGMFALILSIIIIVLIIKVIRGFNNVWRYETGYTFFGYSSDSIV